MLEEIFTYFAWVNLPATALLILVVAYWSLVVLGLADLGGFDLDLGGGEPPVDASLGAGAAASSAGGLFPAVLGFFYLGRVPTMLLLSIFSVCFWLASVYGNSWLNPEHEIAGFVWLWPSTVAVSLLATKIIFWPLLTFFDEVGRPHTPPANTLVGKLAVVSTSEVTDQFGQISVEQQGPPIVLNARAASMDRFQRGETVVIVSHDPDNNTYMISPCGEKK